MSLSTLINSSFKKALFTGSNNEEIIQAYCGGLNTETVHSLCSELEKTLKRNKFPKLIIKRAFFLSLEVDRKSTRLNSSHSQQSRMPSSA